MQYVVLDTDVSSHSIKRQLTGPYVSRMWGRISADATRRGRPRPANDSWIAACCLARELPLATLNVKDFADYVDPRRSRPADELIADSSRSQSPAARPDTTGTAPGCGRGSRAEEGPYAAGVGEQ
jgi:hypothetical protein